MSKNEQNVRLDMKPQYIYITDEDLVNHLKELGFEFIHTDINASTGEQYYQFDLTNEIWDIVYPWEMEKKRQKYSLDRWQIKRNDGAGESSIL